VKISILTKANRDRCLPDWTGLYEEP